MTINKRALVSFSYPPEFDRDSGSRRILNLIELLVAQGWSVTFVASSRVGSPRYIRALQQRGVVVLDGSKIRTEELLTSVQFGLAL
ncbi:MAG TPA: hypothetical protein VEC99_04710, partial [Clostridia bacterium]|nr:hypothetical protein [Clostridia bacterium]